MNNIEFSKHQNCTLGATIHRGHSFLSFDCPTNEIRGDFGFYPQTSESPSLLTYIFGVVTGDQNGFASALDTQYSMGHIAPSDRSITRYVIDFLRSLLPIGVLSSPSLETCSKIGGKGGGTMVINHLIKLHSDRGMIVDETTQDYLWKCQTIPGSCATATLSLSPDKVMKAWNYMVKTSDAGFNTADQCLDRSKNTFAPRFNEYCPLNFMPQEDNLSPVASQFSLIGNNCIDFLRSALKETGHLNLYEQMLQEEIANQPLLYRITSRAWQYFSWTTELNK